MVRIFLASTALSAIAIPATAQEIAPAPAPTLSLSATAEIRIEPEFASVRSGVVSRGDTARNASQTNAATMQRVFRALRDAGIAEADMQTTNLTVRPVYSNGNYSGQNERRIIGYEARNTVTARVRDLGDVGETIDAMVTSGANNIEGVSFGADDTADAMDEARRNAIARLMEKADLFASAASLDLCGIYRLGENFAQPQIANTMAMRGYAEAADTPVAAGTLTISATVSADFCIAPAASGD